MLKRREITIRPEFLRSRGFLREVIMLRANSFTLSEPTRLKENRADVSGVTRDLLHPRVLRCRMPERGFPRFFLPHYGVLAARNDVQEDFVLTRATLMPRATLG